jgi:hypothetical protein
VPQSSVKPADEASKSSPPQPRITPAAAKPEEKTEPVSPIKSSSLSEEAGKGNSKEEEEESEEQGDSEEEEDSDESQDSQIDLSEEKVDE